MLCAISNRQWRAIGRATGLTERLAMVGPLMDVDLDTEGGRFAARHAICAVLEPWFAAHRLDEIRTAFDGKGVLWGPYQDFGQLVAEDPRASTANPIFAEVEQAGVGTLLANGAPLRLGLGDVPPAPAPRLGADTEAVLTGLLGLSTAQYGKLHDAGVVAGPDATRRR
jgi:2-methylfumaryl-CoA isomerase